MSLQQELRKRRPFESPEEEAYLNLLRTTAHLGAEVAALFRAYGLSASAYNVLRILRGHHPQGLPSHQIGEQMVARVPDVTRLVDRLEKMGLAERVRTDHDRRVVIVRITKAGLDVLAKLDRPIAELHKKQLGHLTARELAELNRLLVRARYPDGGENPAPALEGADGNGRARGARRRRGPRGRE